MSCKHPLVRFEYAGGDYKILSLAFVEKNRIDPVEVTDQYGQIPIKIQQIPCTNCWACRLNYSASWANRLSLELKEIPENEKWFVTLTYSDENLHTTRGVDPKTGEIYTSNRLERKDIQKFIKRVRKNCAEKITHHIFTDNEGNEYNIGLRYFGCGEYGSTTERSHYHMIMANIRLDESQLEKFRLNEAHQQLWKCPELEKIWKMGHVVVGKVSWESIAYVARYMMKKQKGQGSAEFYEIKGQIPEFNFMSTHPGIAKEYYEENKNKIYTNDQIAILRKNGAFKIKPPRYFDKLYDVEEHEKMEEIKKHRQEVAEEAMKTKLSKTTLTELELLAVEERTIEERSRKLVRNLD